MPCPGTEGSTTECFLGHSLHTELSGLDPHPEAHPLEASSVDVIRQSTIWLRLLTRTNTWAILRETRKVCPPPHAEQPQAQLRRAKQVGRIF